MNKTYFNTVQQLLKARGWVVIDHVAAAAAEGSAAAGRPRCALLCHRCHTCSVTRSDSTTCKVTRKVTRSDTQQNTCLLCDCNFMRPVTRASNSRYQPGCFV